MTEFIEYHGLNINYFVRYEIYYSGFEKHSKRCFGWSTKHTLLGRRQLSITLRALLSCFYNPGPTIAVCCYFYLQPLGSVGEGFYYPSIYFIATHNFIPSSQDKLISMFRIDVGYVLQHALYFLPYPVSHLLFRSMFCVLFLPFYVLFYLLWCTMNKFVNINN